MIKRATDSKSFGLTVDEILLCALYMGHISRNVNSAISRLKQIKQFDDMEFMKMTCAPLTQFHFDNCGLVWTKIMKDLYHANVYGSGSLEILLDNLWMFLSFNLNKTFTEFHMGVEPTTVSTDLYDDLKTELQTFIAHIS